jgi:hypothetical protein
LNGRDFLQFLQFSYFGGAIDSSGAK